MKMTPAHYETLKARVEPFTKHVPALLGIRQCDPRFAEGKLDLSLTILWDVYHAAKIYDIYSYQEWNYDDSHITTSMKKILSELGVSLNTTSKDS